MTPLTLSEADRNRAGRISTAGRWGMSWGSDPGHSETGDASRRSSRFVGSAGAEPSRCHARGAGRATVFLTVLSASIIALALLADATGWPCAGASGRLAAGDRADERGRRAPPT